MFLLFLSLAGFTVLMAAGLYFFQHAMIYHPVPYGPGFEMAARGIVEEIPFQTAQGRQVALYVAPRKDPHAPPARLWMMFHGNGAQAFDHTDLIPDVEDPEAGFLLIDYPGYGHCEGTAWSWTILESSEGALEALAARVQAPRAALERDIRLFGVSLGCACALQMAVRLHPRRVVLVSPFTSIRDMARLTVGWPLCLLTRDGYDNRARLRELVQRPDPPRVVIFHGSADDIVPVGHGRELASLAPAAIEYIEIENGDHNYILDSARARILAVMKAEE
jgi:alpha-beta hydrolase superfamily lysophospholipase